MRVLTKSLVLILCYFVVSLVALIEIPTKVISDGVKIASNVFNFTLFKRNETVPDLIARYGYPVEVHDVETEDGFILQLHRIPYGRDCGPAEGKKAVFMQHGLLCDSSNWVMNGPTKALGFLLADACYDVWLGNARGNTYSRKHKHLDPVADKEEFWAFSFHEMGIYDVPASIDYILGINGNTNLFYVAHSMGTTMFWICMSERPEYNSKIQLMSALGPVAYTENIKSPLRYITPFTSQIEWLARMIGLYEFLPSDNFYDLMGRTLCKETSPSQIICSNIIFLVTGFDQSQVDPSILPIMLEHLPAGTSASTVVHYAQGVSSGQFRRFDYGTEKNLEKYGQSNPPEYDFTRVTAPVALYWGQNDWLATVPDTFRIAGNLPNLQAMTRVPHDKFNHLDFLIAKDIRTLLNNGVIEFMGTF